MYVDCNGNQFESYASACRYYGAPTPGEARAEDLEMWLVSYEEFIGPLQPKDILQRAEVKLEYTAACSVIRSERNQPGMPRCCDLKPRRPAPPEPNWDDECPF